MHILTRFFSQKKFLDAFISGKLYMNTLNYFWNNGYPLTEYHIATAKPLQDSLNPFYNNATDWYKEAFRTGKVYNLSLIHI